MSVQLGGGTAGVPLSFGTDESPIDITLGSATVRAAGSVSEPTLDIAAILPRIATNHVELIDANITLHSDKFSPASRSGPVCRHGDGRQAYDRQSDRRAAGRGRDQGGASRAYSRPMH